MFDFYGEKYKDGSTFMVLKSLSYFEDAEEDVDTEQILPIEWVDVKKTIELEQKKYLSFLQ